ncbi:hypothetical protein [Burkholderia sp. BCC1993]|uniref:hypothetical protein n=1 Tax=Burkholderia sp. BCC1993 TaxID=2817444 RepID=UPI002AB30277|nr:hypothetical protein [Burkholderia sp. BCC1993]
MTDKQTAAWNGIPHTDDAKEFLEAVMGHPGIAMEHRVEAAKTLMPYHHPRLAEYDEEDDE